MAFILSKDGLYTGISAYLSTKCLILQGSTFHMSMRYCGRIPNSLRIKIMDFFIPNLLEK
jgi:hypothetical protein